MPWTRSRQQEAEKASINGLITWINSDRKLGRILVGAPSIERRRHAMTSGEQRLFLGGLLNSKVVYVSNTQWPYMVPMIEEPMAVQPAFDSCAEPEPGPEPEALTLRYSRYNPMTIVTSRGSWINIYVLAGYEHQAIADMCTSLGCPRLLPPGSLGSLCPGSG